MITTAKGLTSSYAPMGAVIASDRIFEPFPQPGELVHARHHVRRPPGGRRRSRSPTSTCSRNEGILENVRAHEDEFGDMLDSLRDIPIVGDVRGTGYFRAIELVRDQETKETLHRGRGASGCCAASSPPRCSGAG